MKKLRIALVGCGVISDIYLQTLKKFDAVEVVACASLNQEVSMQKAKKYGIAKACTPSEVFADSNIDAVLNLTIPEAHADVSLSALRAGKHVYSEKPLATKLEDAKRIVKLAQANNLYVGCAPDTFLGSRIQTLKHALDSGLVGKPVGVFASACHHGVERHHPNPDFYYQKGGGPLLDLGPYYLTAMVVLLGSVARVSGLANRAFDKRTIESKPRFGELVTVETDTNYCSLLQFESGVIGSMNLSFDVWDTQQPRLEIYGTEGTLCIADPDPVDGTNIFGGEVLFKTRETARWTYRPRIPNLETWNIVENTFDYNENSRGIGLVDMSYAIAETRPARASGELALHICEIMQGVIDSSQSDRFISVQSRCTPPALLDRSFSTSIFSYT